MSAQRHDIGYVGNVWVRMNYLEKAGDIAGGHKHNFDHVSLLCRGKVRVEVDGFPPKEFTAPTFIVIKKQYEHDFVALTDDTLWYCVFSLNAGGDIPEGDIYSADNSPYPEDMQGDMEKLINFSSE